MRISKENIVAREKLAMELFMANPELTAANANKTIHKKLAGGSMNHRRLYEIRSRAQSLLLKEGRIDKRPANKRGRRPGSAVELSANRDVTLPEPSPVELPPPVNGATDETAMLVRIDGEYQAKWLGSVLEQLSGRGLTNAKVVYVGKSHALIAGKPTR